MLISIAEIALTIWACVRFYQVGKCWALGLIPFSAGFFGGYLIGIFLGLLGVSITSAIIPILGITIDLIVIGVLIYLIASNKPLSIQPQCPPVD